MRTTAIAPELFRVPEQGLPYLVAGRCDECGHQFIPRGSTCPQCLGERVNEASLGSTGVLYSFTTVMAAPVGFSSPYRVGYADFNGHRIHGILTGDEPAIGNNVQVEVGVIRESEDTVYISYRFRVTRRGA